MAEQRRSREAAEAARLQREDGCVEHACHEQSSVM